MKLIGTLRARGVDLLIEHEVEDGKNGYRWTSPVISRLLQTPATAGDPRVLLNQLVAVTGRPAYHADRGVAFIVIDRIAPQGSFRGTLPEQFTD